MAEIKNNFTGSKMNQDIDDRLMPSNEYRYALNLEINKSQSSDVGTLQNVLGNSLAPNGDFRSLTGVVDLECIGVLTDDSSDSIYLFLTNHSGTNYKTDAKNYIYLYNSKQNTSTLLVTGAFLNFSTKFPIYGLNILENLLFWTDNRNQPRKININKANPQNLTVPTYYTIEEQISVAKINPLYPANLYRASLLADGDFETTLYDVVSEKLPNGTDNPYYEDNWPGDPAFLESRYVRFSYRYKFEDGEYSIMAPFTQIAYIPEQDGFFMYNTGGIEVNDEESAYRSTIVSFMQNKVNNIYLQIQLPCPANQMESLYKIVEIDILYKEADGIAVNVVDSIPTILNPARPNEVWNTNSTLYSYNYQSKKPFKTLPNRDVIRVNDIVPIKALSQEVISNRVIYGNYQDKFTYPKYLNYNVGVSDKFPFGTGSNEGTSLIEYPNHSVKENRNYQVGIVLGDKFGRESGVILSNNITSENSGAFGGSSLYLPYTGPGETIPYNWPGNSLKILFNETISPENPDINSGWPGIYNGNKNDPNYNPLGWYSYKIVVKQTEQDYYNVYLPGVMAAYPLSDTLELGKTSHAVLINDNINKIPRDLSEVGPGQKQFRSSVILFPRVNNNELAYGNEQYYPGNEYAFVSTIATNNSLFFVNGVSPATLPVGFEKFYQIDSDPLIARISTPKELGVVATSDVINLSVYETKPIESRLDIYWESSTAGLISDLNTAIQLGAPESISIMDGWDFYLSEADDPETVVTNNPLIFKNIIGAEVAPTNVTLISVITDAGVNVTNKFAIENIPGTNYYRIFTKPGTYFYYGFNGSATESYNFSIVASVGTPAVSETFIRKGTLTNVLPTITNKPIDTINKEVGDTIVYSFEGTNGSNQNGGDGFSSLTWSVTGDSIFTIDENGVLREDGGIAQGTYFLRVTMTEASGEQDFVDISVVYPFVEGVVFSSWNTWEGEYVFKNTSGTVTVNNTDATFQACAFAGDDLDVIVSMDINGIFRSVQQNGVGGNCSATFTLPPGTYDYNVSVNIIQNTPGVSPASGSGGIFFTQ